MIIIFCVYSVFINILMISNVICNLKVIEAVTVHALAMIVMMMKTIKIKSY
uniref:NADH dehydrogenase subunit 4L n=1 Tax=Romanomermis culicivorax TaxID=13658 RepID=A0A915KWA1_ROMCU